MCNTQAFFFVLSSAQWHPVPGETWRRICSSALCRWTNQPCSFCCCPGTQLASEHEGHVHAHPGGLQHGQWWWPEALQCQWRPQRQGGERDPVWAEGHRHRQILLYVLHLQPDLHWPTYPWNHRVLPPGYCWWVFFVFLILCTMFIYFCLLVGHWPWP